jgi:hypothetical protein
VPQLTTPPGSVRVGPSSGDQPTAGQEGVDVGTNVEQLTVGPRSFGENGSGRGTWGQERADARIAGADVRGGHDGLRVEGTAKAGASSVDGPTAGRVRRSGAPGVRAVYRVPWPYMASIMAAG